jgi:serine/threonine protein kinase/WD40 repeat protein
MGLAVPTGIGAGQQDPQVYLEESGYYAGFKNDGLLGGGKFLKTMKCIAPNGTAVVVKVYVRRDRNLSLHGYEPDLKVLRDNTSLQEYPNIFPYQSFRVSQKNDSAFLMRQYLPFNLYDRFSTRPFLSKIEKKWITYQLLKGLEQCNRVGLRHGDLKTENILSTSWNWIFLSDFALFKPCFLPIDDPAGFYYFFTAGERRRCYLAPERFYESLEDLDSNQQMGGGKKGGDSADELATMQSTRLNTSTRSLGRPKRERSESIILQGPKHGFLTEAMDVFSAGCVIAETFMDGSAPLFDLAKLLKYRAGGASSRRTLKIALDKFDDPAIVTMLQSMLHHNVNSRLTAENYLQTYTAPDNKTSAKHAFPKSFESFLFPFMASMLLPSMATSDAKIVAICKSYPQILSLVLDRSDSSGEHFFADRLKIHMDEDEDAEEPMDDSAYTCDTMATASGDEEFSELLDRLETDIAELLDLDQKQEKSGILLEGMLEKKARTKLKNWRNKHFEIWRGEDGLRVLQYDGKRDGMQTFTFDEILEAKKSATEPREFEIVMRGETPGLFLRAKDEEERQLWIDAIAIRPAEARRRSSSSESIPKRQATSPLSQEKEFLYKFPEPAESENGVVVILQLICACIETVNSCELRLTALWLLQRLSMFSDDSTRLQRVVPYMVTLLKDRFPLVRAAAIRGLTQVLQAIRKVPLSDAYLFPEYILPNLLPFVTDSAECARLAFVDSLGALVTTSLRFLNVSHAAKETIALAGGEKGKEDGVESGIPPTDASSLDTSNVLVDGSFDFELDRIREMFGNIISNLVSAARTSANSGQFRHSMIKQALLNNLGKLCHFFGPDYSNEKVFPWMISFMNDREDWQLRRTFFQTISAAAPYISDMVPTMLPFVEDAMADFNELVIREALVCLTELTRMEQRGTQNLVQLKSTCERTAPLLCHPCHAIRICATKFFALLCRMLSPMDVQVFVYSSLRCFVRGECISLDPAMLEDEDKLALYFESILMPPMEREYFDAILQSESCLEESEVIDTEAVAGTNTDSWGVGTTVKTIHSGKRLLLQYLRSAWSQYQFMCRFNRTEDFSGTGSFSSDIPRGSTRSNAGAPTFTGPLPLDKFFNLQGVPKRTISVPDQRFLLSSDYARRNRRGSSRNKMDNAEELECVYGVVAEHIDGMSRLKKQFAALRIPKLPPYMGFLYDNGGFEYSTYNISPTGAVYKTQYAHLSDTKNSRSVERQKSPGVRSGAVGDIEERPGNRGVVKANLLAKLAEHESAITSIAIPDDHSLLLTSSLDGSIRLWNPEMFFHSISVRSSARHKACDGGAVTSMVTIDNSKTFVYGTDQGTIEAVCVENAPFSRVRMDKTSGEGAVCGISSALGSISSSIIYATEGGRLRGVDLRMRKSTLAVSMHPDLGSITSLAMAPDQSCPWMVVGTRKGYVSLWDLRFNVMSKLWRHQSQTPVRKLLIPSETIPGISEDRPVMFVAAGNNEVSIWDMLDSSCHSVYRSLPESATETTAHAIPVLREIPICMNGAHESTSGFKTFPGRETHLDPSPGAISASLHGHSIASFIWTGRGLMGQSISPFKLITGGSEKYIRVWETVRHQGSYTYQFGSGKNLDHLYDSFHGGSNGQTRVSTSQTIPSLRSRTTTEQNGNHQMASEYTEGNILDMKFLYRGNPLLMTGDAQGLLRVYRW